MPHMTAIDITHHKVLATVLILLVFITAIFFGVKIIAGAGVEGMLVILFAFAFLSIILLFLLYVQIVHLLERRARK